MDGKDCVLQVKYSIKLKSQNGDTPPLKKKIKKTYSGDDTPVILEQIKSMNNDLYQQHDISGQTINGNSFVSSCRRFLQTWKCAYYEMLRI